jgi:hypothetical protein
MGEYIRYRGEDVKLGTCEDLYYVTYEQARQLLTNAAPVPGNLPPAEYVNPRHGWRYRFPFPEEDDRAPGTHADHDKGRVVCCPPGALFALPPDNHDTLCVSIGLGGVRGSGGCNVNTRVACPASGMLKPHSPIGSWPVEIVQQPLMADGSLWTVLRCGWCGEKYRIDRTEAEALAAFLCQYERDERSPNRAYWQTVAERILAGYPDPALVVK